MAIQITSRKQAEDLLVQKALQDDAFRRELVANPSAAIGKVVGAQPPPDLKITVLEESSRQLYLVLPAREASGELAEHELAGVAGGAATTEDRAWGKVQDFFGSTTSSTTSATGVHTTQNVE